MAGTPAAAEVKKVCGRHSRKPAVAMCGSCATSICRDCMVPTSVGIKCTSCTGQRGAGLPGGGKTGGSRVRGRRGPGGRSGGGRPGWVRPTVAVAAVIALVAVGSAVLGGDDSGDSVRSRTAAVGDAEPLNRQVQIPATGDVNLSATLSLPPGSGPGSELAGVVILAGFGPTNRDGTAPAGGVPDLLYRDVSDVLVESGMATLRYDKRGTGRTLLPDGEPLRVADLVTDAAAAVKFLAERAEVDPDRIAVVGHEEGGLVAMALAASEPTVRGLGLISVPGRPLVDVLADDFAGAPPGADIPALRGVVATLLATGALPETIPTSLAGYFPVDNEEYLFDLFSADPVALASQVQVPALFVRGAEATLVTAADETALVGALGPDTEALVVPGAGPSLAIVDQVAPPVITDPRHGAPGAAHDAIGAVPNSERSQAALTRLATFLGNATKI